MKTLREALLLRVFIGEADRKGSRALYCVIVEAARRAGLAGATALHGPLSYGLERRINFEFNVDAPGNLPMVIEIVDAEARIEGFLPELDKLIGSGLVTLEKVRMARAGRLTKQAE
jgi:PII-like signaling protein